MIKFPAELRHMDPQIQNLSINYHSATPLFHSITKLLTFTQLVYNERAFMARYNLPIAQSLNFGRAAVVMDQKSLSLHSSCQVLPSSACWQAAVGTHTVCCLTSSLLAKIYRVIQEESA